MARTFLLQMMTTTTRNASTCSVSHITHTKWLKWTITFWSQCFMFAFVYFLFNFLLLVEMIPTQYRMWSNKLYFIDSNNTIKRCPMHTHTHTIRTKWISQFILAISKCVFPYRFLLWFGFSFLFLFIILLLWKNKKNFVKKKHTTRPVGMEKVKEETFAVRTRARISIDMLMIECAIEMANPEWKRRWKMENQCNCCIFGSLERLGLALCRYIRIRYFSCRNDSNEFRSRYDTYL